MPSKHTRLFVSVLASALGIASTALGAAPTLDSIPTPVHVGTQITLHGQGITAGSVLKVFVATAAGPQDVSTANGLTPSSITGTTFTVSLPFPWPVADPNTKFTVGNGFVGFQLVRTDMGFDSSNLVGAELLGNDSLGVPSVTGINGTPLSATSTDPSIGLANVEGLVLGGSVMTIQGSGFASSKINIFTASGNIGPLDPSSQTGTSISVPIPPTVPTGPGSVQVVNTTNFRASNSVSIPIGALVTVSSVSQIGSVVTVNGSGFNSLTVINLFAFQGGILINAGGLNPNGTSKISLTIVNPTKLTFTLPAGLDPGPAYVQVINPPFIPYSASTGLGGAFQLVPFVSLTRTDYLLSSHLNGLDSVVVADLDGQHGPDIVVGSLTADTGMGEVNVLLNNGDGTFAEPLVFESCVGATSLVVGQFNPSTDAHLDVAMTCGPTGIGRMVGDGQGNLGTIEVVNVGYTGYDAGTGDPYTSIMFMLRSGAMNGPSLAYASVLAGLGTTLCFLEVAQLEDILDSAQLSRPFCHLHLDAQQTIDEFGPATRDLVLGENHAYPEDPFPRDEAISFGGEFPEPGLAVTAYTPFFQSTWSYAVRSNGGVSTAVAMADVDGDGQSDILMGGEGGIADYVPGWPIEPGTQPTHVFSSIAFLYDMVTADFDGDGKIDIAALGDDDFDDDGVTLAIHHGNGDGTFAPYQRFTARGDDTNDYVNVIAFGDFDGNGKLDLVTVGRFDRYASVLLGF